MTAGSGGMQVEGGAFEAPLVSAPDRPLQSPESAHGTPLIVEAEEAVDIRGVRLFTHVFDERMRDAALRSSRFTIEPGSGTHEDRHAVHEIWFISSGELEVCYDGEWYRVEAGQAVFFEPWRPHYTRNVGAGNAQIFSVWWA